MIVVLDNHDSFVYNLARYAEELGHKTQVIRSDAMDIRALAALNPTHFILSPGPCTPKEAGITLDTVRNFYKKIPILGVCLGHQAIAEAFGGQVVRSNVPMHGKQDCVTHTEEGIFGGLTNPLCVARYHSLMVEKNSLPACLKMTATNQEALIMGLQHKEYPTFGVQFHPESVLTEQGHKLLENFLNIKGDPLN